MRKDETQFLVRFGSVQIELVKVEDGFMLQTNDYEDEVLWHCHKLTSDELTALAVLLDGAREG